MGRELVGVGTYVIHGAGSMVRGGRNGRGPWHTIHREPAMIDLQTLATIVAMAGSTYLTRIIGYLALRNRTLSSRTRKLLDNVPGCVLVSMIAPAFVPRNPADTIALAVTLLAALRLSLLPTVLIGIGATALSRHYLL